MVFNLWQSIGNQMTRATGQMQVSLVKYIYLHILHKAIDANCLKGSLEATRDVARKPMLASWICLCRVALVLNEFVTRE